MNESTKSTPLLTWLRAHTAGRAVVFKHADRATIGIPDASLTWVDRTTWLEFKLYCPNRSWGGVIPFESIAQKHPVQYEVAKRLAANGSCYYVMWVKRRQLVAVWNPITKESWSFTSLDDLGSHILHLHKEMNR